MKVSIITISFNSEKTIERAIESVRKQTIKAFEYIVVDGGSTDRTVEIINNNTDLITKWVSEPDNGISDAFNKGIKMATGDLICLLNSDDELNPEAIEIATSSVDEVTDIVHGNLIWVDEKGLRKVKKPNCDYHLLCVDGMYLNHPGMFIKKTAYDRYGLYDCNYRCGMDRELLARMYHHGAVFKYVDKTLAIFYCGGESTQNYIKHALPESKKITMLYGVSSGKASFIILKKKTKYLFSQIKKKAIWLFTKKR